MKNKKIIIAVIFMAFSLQVFPQLKKADRQFELFRYSKAIPLYKKAVKKKDMNVRKEATAKLADCYRLINDVNEARAWYMKATEFPDPDPMNYYYLGQALRSLEQYDEAEKAFTKYSSLVTTDPKGPVYAEYSRKIVDWKDLPPSAEVKNMGHLNSKYADFGPVFYKNGIVYTSDRQLNLLDKEPYYWTSFSYLDLFYSEPKYYKDFWSDMSDPSSLSSKFNQTYHDGPAFFVNNDSKMFITRTKLEKVKKGAHNIETHVLKIYYADLNKEKPEYLQFAFNNDNYSNGHPTLFSDQKTMIFVSDMPGGKGGSDLYKTVMGDNGSWSKPENLGDTLNTFGDEVFPYLVNDTMLFFSSTGNPGYGGLDIFVSRFVNGKWGAPVNLKAPINSSHDDFAIAVSKDLKSGFFSSDRPGGEGSDDIYAFRNAEKTLKEDLLQQEKEQLDAKAGNLIVSGYVKDRRTNIPIDGAKIYMLNTKTNKVKILETDPKGFFSTPAEKGVLYVTKAVKPDFFNDCLNFRIAPTDTATRPLIPADLLLDKVEVNQTYLIENIYYDFDKWYIREDAKPALDNLVDIMRNYPITIELSSHTDCRASHGYNDELSQKRAESAVRYIMLQGIDPSRMIAKGYGETKPVNRCKDGVYCSEPDHQANRRTEFRILSMGAAEEDNQIDPELFKTGDEVDVYLFDPDFFRKCFGEKDSKKGAKKLLPKAGASTSTMKMQPEKPVLNSDNCYGVQLLASIQEIPLNSPQFKGISDIKSYLIGKWHKYVTGCEKTYEDASILRNKLARKGFNNAFVVKIENGSLVKETKTETKAELKTKTPEPITPKKLSEEKAPEITKPVNDPNTCYGVQLMATLKEVSVTAPEFKGLTNIKSYPTGKWYKYVTGCAKTYEEAFRLRDEFVGKGFEKAFIVKIEDGKVIKDESRISNSPLAATTKTESSGISNTSGKLTDNCYGVQLLAIVNEIPLSDPGFSGIPDVKRILMGKWYKYVTGCENTYEEAARLRNDFIAKGFASAFVIRMENGKVINAH